MIGLLAQEAEAGAVDDDVVARRRARARSRRRRAGCSDAPCRISREERLRVVVELARRRVVEDRRELALQIPGVEEELPVDVRHELGERRARPRARRRTAARAGRRSARDARFVARRRRAAAAGCLSFSACCSRSRSCSTRFSSSSSRRRFGSSRRETTSTTRLASSTCTVSLPYSGAIFTAVCCREVVAPPIRSGSSSRRRSISRATSTIWSSDGVISPERPTTSTPSALGGVEDPCRAGPSRRGRSPRSRCSRARRRRCSCRCRARRP